jgi:mannose-1-phosphate guanylyltransferase
MDERGTGESMLYGAIMAGGAGTRLWPLSRKRRPKQAIPLAGGPSLFERTVARLEGIVPSERILVITTSQLVRTLGALVPAIPRGNFVGEPVGRDSAAAVFLAASIVAEKDPEAVMLVCAADHLISPKKRFQAAVARAVALAKKDFLVTFGIRPTRPSTAYGYIERGRPLGHTRGAHLVKKFHEKPDAATARRYASSKRFFWNSGLFAWKASTILAAAREYAPGHARALENLGALFGTTKFAGAVRAAYNKLPRISIDYAVMEKADNVAVVESDFEWSDVGGPIALRTMVEADHGGNVKLGLVDLLDSKGCVAISGDDRLLAVFGCEDLVVIQTHDATLVCPASRADELKKLVKKLESDARMREFL